MTNISSVQSAIDTLNEGVEMARNTIKRIEQAFTRNPKLSDKSSREYTEAQLIIRTAPDRLAPLNEELHNAQVLEAEQRMNALKTEFEADLKAHEQLIQQVWSADFVAAYLHQVSEKRHTDLHNKAVKVKDAVVQWGTLTNAPNLRATISDIEFKIGQVNQIVDTQPISRKAQAEIEKVFKTALAFIESSYYQLYKKVTPRPVFHYEDPHKLPMLDIDLRKLGPKDKR